MRQRAFVIDLALAVVVAVLILVVSPGLAVTAIVALILLAGFGLDGILRRRRRRRDHGRRARTRSALGAVASRGDAGRAESSHTSQSAGRGVTWAPSRCLFRQSSPGVGSG